MVNEQELDPHSIRVSLLRADALYIIFSISVLSPGLYLAPSQYNAVIKTTHRGFQVFSCLYRAQIQDL